MSVNVAALQQAQRDGVTLGVVPQSGLGLRMEIDEMAKVPELFNLYLLALEAVQNASRDVNDHFSWYEIGGIHGAPYRRGWNGVGNRGGYCTHGDPTFPTWHRAYLAMYEQALYVHAARIAPALGVENLLPGFRIPYMDPFAPRMQDSRGRTIYGIPVILTIPKCRVQRQRGGNWVTIDNPLYKFTLPQNRTSQESESMIPQTTRNPGDRIRNDMHTLFSPSSSSPGSGGSRSDPAQTLWRVLLDNSGKDWLWMSNHSALSPGTGQAGMGSVESFHDNIHVDFGGSMGAQNWAGFDPAFWLHHCNVDRLIAIWQGIRVDDGDATEWWDPREVSQRQSAPDAQMPPFRKTKTSFWTSNDVRDHRKMGYDYPETRDALRSGKVTENLTQWANNTLGSRNSGLPFNASKVSALTQSFTLSAPFWPLNENEMAYDGEINKSYRRLGYRYLGSNPTNTRPVPRSLAAEQPSQPAQPALAAMSSPLPTFSMMAMDVPLPHTEQKKEQGQAAPEAKKVHTTLSAQAKKAPATPSHEHDHQVEPVPQPVKDIATFLENVVKHAIPTDRPTVADRCGHHHKLVSHNKMTHWNIYFTVDKFSLDGSFQIIFFLGDFNSNHSQWNTEFNIAGVSNIFASSREVIDSGGCSNCAFQEERNLKYGDLVSITQPILTYYNSQEDAHGHKITNLDPHCVVPFLQRELHWRIVKADGNEVPRENVPSLKVGVFSEEVYMPDDITQRPTFSDRQMHYEITAGRPNGINPGESFI